MVFLSLVFRPALFNTFAGIMGLSPGLGLSALSAGLQKKSKLSGGVNILEGRGAIQRDRLERKKLLKFNKAECKVLPVGWGNLKHKDRWKMD